MSGTTTTVDPARPLTAAAVITLGVALVLLELPVLVDLAALWRSVPYYSHGLLIPLFSAWLVWDTRHTLRLGPGGKVLGSGVIVLGIGVLALGFVLESLTVRALSVPVLALGLAIVCFGPRRLGPVAFPIGFLVLMAPLPGDAIARLSLPLQHLAASAAVGTMHTLGIPAFHDGLFIRLERVTLHVSEACNGVRFLFAMIPVGVALAGLAMRGAGRRAGVVVLAVAFAVAANVIRVSGTALIAHAWGAEAASGILHLAYGKVIYAAMLVPFAAAVLMLRRGVRSPATT